MVLKLRADGAGVPIFAYYRPKSFTDLIGGRLSFYPEAAGTRKARKLMKIKRSTKRKHRNLDTHCIKIAVLLVNDPNCDTMPPLFALGGHFALCGGSLAPEEQMTTRT